MTGVNGVYKQKKLPRMISGTVLNKFSYEELNFLTVNSAFHHFLIQQSVQ
jgi:hypothetical protein